MDYGFVYGSDWSATDNDGKLVTSVDKCRLYLLVIDRTYWYIWIFLTKTKSPAIEQVSGLLKKVQCKFCSPTTTTDQGTELGCSFAFCAMVKKFCYTLRTTGANSSAQNALAENQMKTWHESCVVYYLAQVWVVNFGRMPSVMQSTLKFVFLILLTIGKRHIL